MPPYENRPGWGKNGERMNFTDRCAIAVACLPKADYRTQLEKLHAEMLAALDVRVPLTDEQIDAALDAARVGELPDGWTSIERDIARAIEAAHGITAAKDKP